MCTHRSTRTRQAFTLIEILIVVVILGILAAIVIPQFTDASIAAMHSSLRTELATIRSQIELYNVQNPANPYDATVAAPGDETFWDPLVQGDYLQTAPLNPLTDKSTNNPSAVNAAPAVGGAWLWFEASAGDPWTLMVYAVDENGNLFTDPDTGKPY
ncbi:MAG: type II secretion system protein [Planctomycetota bacterium]|jgi:general secretion pathway protein G